MVFVENKRKELKTSYKDDTLEVGKEMGLLPEGKLGLKTNVLRRNRAGIQ